MRARALLLIPVLLVGGCADSERASATQLTITVVADTGAAPQVWQLQCDPVGGDHPDPPGACAFLADQQSARADPFAPVPAGSLCTQQFNGPATATVEGEWDGAPVSASFKLTDGCEIRRWEIAQPLLVAPSA